MNVLAVQKLLNALNVIATELGPDLTLRQLSGLLHIAQAGNSGIDGTTLERKMNSSQAATSRTMKLLGPTHGLAEYYLDQADGRRRLARLCPKGEKLLNHALRDLALI